MKFFFSSPLISGMKITVHCKKERNNSRLYIYPQLVLASRSQDPLAEFNLLRVAVLIV